MQIGYVGLGKMGVNMVARLIEKTYEVIVFDKNLNAVKSISQTGAYPVRSLKSLVHRLVPPRHIWIMVPHIAVDAVIGEILPHLQRKDVIIDGGNSPYKKSMKRFHALDLRGIDFLDAGVSGGPSGARNGACIMVGGKIAVFRKCKKLFRDLSCRGGFGYMGKAGAGHFVKMVHNGIEYGMMQSLAEGFSVLKAAPFELDLPGIADLYNHKSVIESRLVGWLKKAFDQHGENLGTISGKVSHSGEGAWTIETAREFGIPVPVIENALKYRIQSQSNPSYTGKLLSAMRNQFGGHDVFRKSR